MKESYSLQELAGLFQLTLYNCPDISVAITGVGTLQNAESGQIAFLENKSYQKYLSYTNASAVILSHENKDASSVPVIISSNPYLDYARIAQLFNRRPKQEYGIHPTAVIGKNCTIPPDTSIGAYCFIGDNCKIGQGTVLFPQVTVFDDTILGQNVCIHSGAVIGSDGFGNAKDYQTGRWVKVPQLGRVVIGNDVEIGANTTIDRGSIEDTIIEENVRLDNQIQIAHNVKIGAYTAIAGCVGIAGSTKIGKHCLIGGAVNITGHIEIVDCVIIAAASTVINSILIPGIYASTSVLQKRNDWRRTSVRLKHLSKLFDRVKFLEKFNK